MEMLESLEMLVYYLGMMVNGLLCGPKAAVTAIYYQEPFEEAAGFGNATWPSSLTNEDAVLPTRRSELQPKQQHCEQVAEEGEGEHGVEKRGK